MTNEHLTRCSGGAQATRQKHSTGTTHNPNPRHPHTPGPRAATMSSQQDTCTERWPQRGSSRGHCQCDHTHATLIQGTREDSGELLPDFCSTQQAPALSIGLVPHLARGPVQKLLESCSKLVHCSPPSEVPLTCTSSLARAPTRNLVICSVSLLLTLASSGPSRFGLQQKEQQQQPRLVTKGKLSR